MRHVSYCTFQASTDAVAAQFHIAVLNLSDTLDDELFLNTISWAIHHDFANITFLLHESYCFLLCDAVQCGGYCRFHKTQPWEP